MATTGRDVVVGVRSGEPRRRRRPKGAARPRRGALIIALKTGLKLDEGPLNVLGNAINPGKRAGEGGEADSSPSGNWEQNVISVS